MKLFLDDERTPAKVYGFTKNPIYEENWHIVTDYDEFIRYIQNCENRLPSHISFDHDLGEDVAKTLVKWGHSKKKARQYKKNLKSGYDCAKWLIEYVDDHNYPLPEILVHSQNPVGKENIISLFEFYKKYFSKL